MKNSLIFLLFLLFISNLSIAQNLRFSPYLQDAEPDSIYILWETDAGDESTVEWGSSLALGNVTTGSFEVSANNHRIHTVFLQGLTSNSKYYYRIKTGQAVSEIYSFKTPPLSGEQSSVKIVLFSDIQLHNQSLPNIFDNIIHTGITDYFQNEYGGEIIDNLSMILIPGDLVNDGTDYDSWHDYFFQFSDDLFCRIPFYPILGNHEFNSNYYFQYFKLPANGFNEHWWYKDFANVRIIGLDSNISNIDENLQLQWLDDRLNEAANMPEIDFVILQLHHPFKSELWTPGELAYTGDVISRLEQFSSVSGKPCVHFFGHTHAYSRGQSRDYKHLWINVASGGGAIDYWGAFPNHDYDEFSVSQDEYGFVLVEITDDADPRMIIKRISIGDDYVNLNNQVRDSLVVRLQPQVIEPPVAVSPVNETVSPECVYFSAGQFQSNFAGALHGQTHWQIVRGSPDFSQPDIEIWRNYENWYNDINTQANDDLTDENLIMLQSLSTYWWRVRYRDRELNWSNWSNPVSFNTSASSFSDNLIENPGAENMLSAWNIAQGEVQALTDGECNGTNPHSGNLYFAVGGLCPESPVGVLVQDVDVTTYSNEIDNGNYYAFFGGFLSNYSGNDLPEMRLIFLDANQQELGSTGAIYTYSNQWTELSDLQEVPGLTRKIRVELKGTRNAGQDNDSYFDDVYLKLGNMPSGCNSLGINNIVPEINTLAVIPNPLQSESFIRLHINKINNPKLYIIDAGGTKVDCRYEIENNGVKIYKDNLPAGVYLFWIKEKNNVIGKGKFIVE